MKTSRTVIQLFAQEKDDSYFDFLTLLLRLAEHSWSCICLGTWVILPKSTYICKNCIRNITRWHQLSCFRFMQTYKNCTSYVNKQFLRFAVANCVSNVYKNNAFLDCIILMVDYWLHFMITKLANQLHSAVLRHFEEIYFAQSHHCHWKLSYLYMYWQSKRILSLWKGKY